MFVTETQRNEKYFQFFNSFEIIVLDMFDIFMFSFFIFRRIPSIWIQIDIGEIVN